MAISVAESGDTRTCATIWSTVTVATPVAAPLAAVTTALPFPNAVTRPKPSTRTTDASVVVYAIGTPAISSPFWLSTVAASRIVSPSASSVTDEGSRVTVVATSPDGGDGASTAGTSSPQLTIRHRMAARQRTLQRR